MSVRTDANVIGINPLDPGAGNTMITKGTSNLKTMKVTINGEEYFVETRYDKGDGTTAAVVVARTEIERTVTARGSRTRTVTDTVDTPWVLFTTDSDGNTTFGGEGRTDNPDSPVDIGPMHTTTEATAKAILATAEIDGFAATESAVVAEHNVRSNQLHKNSRKDDTPLVNSGVPAVQGVTPIEATIEGAEPVPIPVVPYNQDTEPEDNLEDDGERPENSNPLDQLTDAAGNLIETGIEKFKEFSNNAKITQEDLDNFSNKFKNEEGIVTAFYPIDNLYGKPFGQDYVTIDQFEYQSPRRQQIFALGNENALDNYTQGNQRITPLKKFIAKVKLPMPNSIGDSNNVDWGNGDTMNNLTAAIVSGAMKDPATIGAAAIGTNMVGNLLGVEGLGRIAALAGIAYKGSSGDNLNQKLADLQRQMGESPGAQTLFKTSVGSAILGMAGVQVSPESILQRGLGVVPNSNMELLFNSPKLRDFQFSWKMSPRDVNEAKQVKAIIRFFKQGMAARTLAASAGGRSLFLGTPNVFRLQYRTANDEIIEGVNRIKPCAVTGTSVDYTPDGIWSAYDRGQPVSTVLTIRMSELEPVYASDYSANVIKNRRSGEAATRETFVGPLADPSQAVVDIPAGDSGDLYKIRPTEVGY